MCDFIASVDDFVEKLGELLHVDVSLAVRVGIENLAEACDLLLAIRRKALNLDLVRRETDELGLEMRPALSSQGVNDSSNFRMSVWIRVRRIRLELRNGRKRKLGGPEG